MTSRTRKRFLVAAQDQPDWFQAVREGTAKTDPDAVHVPRLGSRLRNLYLQNPAQLSDVLDTAPVVKAELALAVAQDIIAAPQKLEELLPQVQDAELWARKLHVKPDVQEQLFTELTAEFGSRTLAMDELNRCEDDLSYMRELPNSSYTLNRGLKRAICLAAAMELLNVMMSVPALAKAEELAEFLQQLKSRDLVELSNKLNPARTDDYVRSSLAAHWQDAGRRPDGTLYDGFTIHGKYFVRPEVAQNFMALAPRI